MLTIGCHLSTTKGYRAMGETALSIGANTFAFFTRNPRGGRAKAIDPKDIAAFAAYAPEHGIERILAHAPYMPRIPITPARPKSGRASLPWRQWPRTYSVWKRCPATTTTSIPVRMWGRVPMLAFK